MLGGHSDPGSVDLGEYVASGSLPFVGLGMLVSIGKIGLDVLDQVPDTAKASFAHDIACEVGEEPLHQIQPGTRRGRKMHVKTRVTLHPRADVGVLVSAVVVRDHVNFQVLGVSRSICLRKRNHSTWVCFASVRLMIFPSR